MLMKNHTRNKIHTRIPELDLLRGIAVLFMIFDHFMYDTGFLLPALFPGFPEAGSIWDTAVQTAAWYWSWGVRTAVRYIILAVFLLLTGICCSFSKSNLRRGGKLMLAALGLTAATYVLGQVAASPEMTITFGVLHCIALALILIGLLETVIRSKWIWLALGTALTCAGAVLYRNAVPLSYGVSGVAAAVAGQILGVAVAGGDSFPFPLFGGQVFLGVFLGRQLYPHRRSLCRKPYRNNAITFIGRNSLAAYFAHQLILPLLLGAILLLLGY